MKSIATDARVSDWLKDYINHLLNEEFDEGTRRFVGDDIENFRVGFAIATLEIKIARSLFLSTWEDMRTILGFKSLADRTAEIRNFIAHGIEVVHRGAPPYARLVNARHYSQPYSIEYTRDADGVLGPKTDRDNADMQKLINLNRSCNVYHFVENEFAKQFISEYAPTQLDQDNSLSGLTSAEVFQLQQGLVKEREEIVNEANRR